MSLATRLSRRGFASFGSRRRQTVAIKPTSASATLPEHETGISITASGTRDRTAEASTSQAGAGGMAARAKKERAPPTPLKPGPIEDTDILQNSVILVDKPLGWTSFDVCGKIRNMIKFLGIKKVGHAGTLDPNASGLLIVCTGQGTKFCDDFMAQDKEYSGTLRLGEGTVSYDAESEVSERLPWEHITDADLEAAAARFIGDIMQVPPMFSALKVGGQKLCNLAREGATLELPPRPVTISSLRVWRSGDNRQDVHFHVACSKGTYIRSLAYDLGRALGSAAHLVALRREASGVYRAEQAWQLPELIAELDRHKQAFLATQPQQQQQEGAAQRRGGKPRRERREVEGQSAVVLKLKEKESEGA